MTTRDWKALVDYWLSLDPPQDGPRRRGRPQAWHSTAVFPIVLGEIRQQHPELKERTAAGLLADYIIGIWAPRRWPYA